jgi:uncharacterized damage-inducible protein DinB
LEEENDVKMIRMMSVALLCWLAAPVIFGQTQEAPKTLAETYNQLLNIAERQIVGAADAMPADKYNFAPTQGDFQGVRTFAEQVKHLTEANYGFFQGWNVPGAVKRDDIEKLTSKDDLLKALRDSYAYAHKAIDTLTPSNYLESSSFGPAKSTRAGAAAFCVAHSMDHYGQMVEYLRMNGIVPPASRKS